MVIFLKHKINYFQDGCQDGHHVSVTKYMFSGSGNPVVQFWKQESNCFSKMAANMVVNSWWPSWKIITFMFQKLYHWIPFKYKSTVLLNNYINLLKQQETLKLYAQNISF